MNRSLDDYISFHTEGIGYGFHGDEYGNSDHNYSKFKYGDGTHSDGFGNGSGNSFNQYRETGNGYDRIWLLSNTGRPIMDKELFRR